MAHILDRVGARLSGWSREIRDTVLDPKPSAADADSIAEVARDQAPVIWMLGIVGAGKSSIIRTLTGCTEAEIGNGFEPCTRQSRIFDFPAEAPVMRFLDTRGLGEVAYDPAEDLKLCEARAHLVLVVASAMNPVPAAVIKVIREVRHRHPDWPVVVAQTCLHRGYGGARIHPLPYPFADGGTAPGLERLNRCLAHHREQMKGLPGSGQVLYVPIDFTDPENGLEPVDYGIDALWAAIAVAASDGVGGRLRQAVHTVDDARITRALPHIYGYATAAGAADAFPLVGLVTVPVIQGKMLHSLAGIFGVEWTRARLLEFFGCLGTGTLLRVGLGFGARQVVKLVPAYGWLIGAATAAVISFTVTFAIGRAAAYYLRYTKSGQAVDAEEIAAQYRAALDEAMRMVRDGEMFRQRKSAK